MNPLTHLWESTICVGVIALLAIALRHQPARTRHALWLLASIKFLVPFSFITAGGRSLGLWAAAIMPSQVSGAVRWLDESLVRWSLDAIATSPAGFLPGPGRIDQWALAIAWTLGAAAVATWRCTQWRSVARLARAATPLEHGREADALGRVSRRSRRSRRIQLLLVDSSFEPGVLGVLRPRLLWPAGLSERLSDAELDAILAHELCHVDRRDNASALVHVVVETLFWCHPVVWWLGTRLVSERERACDEEVLDMGFDQHTYAESILEVCGFSLRAPAAFIAGVSGLPVTQRIERILSRRVTGPTRSTRWLLAVVVMLTMGGPLVTGLVSAQRETQVYETTDEGVKAPRLIRDVKPKYTADAMRARIEGVVRLEAVVLPSGLVGEVTVLESLDAALGLDEEAVKALKQWEFDPGTKDGTPVAVRVKVEMSFRLK
jgi:TonB family protein